MTDPRKSVALALEVGDFGSGAVKDAYGQPVMPGESGGIFYALPPGAWCSHSNEFKAESIYATGSKLRETAAYGQFSGSWSIKFIMDYEHTEVLDLVFDKHTVSTAVSGVTTEMGQQVYDHSWEKDNATFIKPFVIREKILNRIANKWNENVRDEVVFLKGCIVKSMKISRSAQGSQMQAELSGMFADMEVQLADLTMTDYTVYDNTIGPTQYSCMFLDDISSENYVRDVDSHSISIDTGATLVYNTCTPFATAYFEGQNSFSWDARTFANDPEKKFQLRPFSGGKDAMHLKPMSKGLAPMAEADFITYNLSYRDDPDLEDVVDAWDMSPYRIGFTLIDSTVNAMSWSDGEGEKITDTLQSVECTKITVTVRNTHPTTDWSNIIILNGEGEPYTPVSIDATVAKLRPVVEVDDEDVNSNNEEYEMAEGTYVTVTSDDLSRGKARMSGTTGSSFEKVLRDWIVIPYTSELYEPASDAPTILEELLGLTSTQAEDLVDSGLQYDTDWIAHGLVTISNGEPTVSTYYPVTTFSGTLGSMGTYKYYIMKVHLIPTSDGGRQLIVEDRGVLRVDVNPQTTS